MDRERRIAHLDMDAFFASVELLRYPMLKGQAVVVGGRSTKAPFQDESGQWHYAKLKEYVGRGVVTTSTYEARALGVFSGMGLMQSAKLAPDAILLPADFEAYRHYSRQFKTAVKAIAPLIEDRGIDEIYIDLTDVEHESREIAVLLKRAVYQATGLTCSIAVAPNKLLAKIGSDLDKPDGLTILTMEDVPSRIWPLSVGKINGIGPKATLKLKEHGVETIGQLAQQSREFLVQLFGTSTGDWMYRVSRGQDDRPIVTHSDPKSVSRETTFARDLDVRADKKQLSEILEDLCFKLSNDLKRKGVVSRTIGVKVKFADFKVITRDISVDEAIQDPVQLRRAGRECLRRIEWSARIRLLGIRAGNLSRVEEIMHQPRQLSLWG